MVQVIAATFEDGVFKPDEALKLRPQTRVRLLVETLDDESNIARRQQAWDTVQRLWKQSAIDSEGKHLSREQLHERH
jgi:predicted DNA-binding antitoxin AbrB/MazE fold protein